MRTRKWGIGNKTALASAADSPGDLPNMDGIGELLLYYMIANVGIRNWELGNWELGIGI